MRRLFLVLLAILGPGVALAQSGGAVTVGGNVPSVVSADNSTVVLSANQIPADNSTLVVITVTLEDSSNQAVANKPVSISSNRGDVDTVGVYVNGELTEPKTGSSDGSGQIVFAIRSKVAGVATVSILADTVTLTTKPTVTFTPLPILSNLTIKVTLPGGKQLTILSPPASSPPAPSAPSAPTPTTIPADLVNNGIALNIPPAAGLAILIAFLGELTLLILVIIFGVKLRRSIEKESRWQNNETALLKKLYAMEQQVSTQQQALLEHSQPVKPDSSTQPPA